MMDTTRFFYELALILAMIIGCCAMCEDDPALYKASTVAMTLVVGLFIFRVVMPRWIGNIKDANFQELLDTIKCLLIPLFAIAIVVFLQGTEGFEGVDMEETKLYAVMAIIGVIAAIAIARFLYQRHHRRVHGDQNGEGRKEDEE